MRTGGIALNPVSMVSAVIGVAARSKAWGQKLGHGCVTELGLAGLK